MQHLEWISVDDLDVGVRVWHPAASRTLVAWHGLARHGGDFAVPLQPPLRSGLSTRAEQRSVCLCTLEDPRGTALPLDLSPPLAGTRKLFFLVVAPPSCLLIHKKKKYDSGFRA